MKTEVPLQGFRVSASHPEVHLSMFLAQLVCMLTYKDVTCNNHLLEGVQVTFLLVHLYCFIGQLLEKYLRNKNYLLLSNLIEISCVILYFVTIYLAHFFELETIYNKEVIYCQNKQLVSARVWYLIELRVFYGFIITASIFLMCA